MGRMKKDSFRFAAIVVSVVATIFTIIGFSIKDVFPSSNYPCFAVGIILRLLAVSIFYLVVFLLALLYKGFTYRNSIKLKIGDNNVFIKTGDIFKEDYWRVIPFDTSFETTIDDVIISKSSLHGKLVLEHGDATSIKKAVMSEAKKRNITKGSDGRFSFKLGTAIPYEGKDGHYFLVALTKLNEENEAHTSMAQYEHTLMEMWKNINGKYEKYPIVLPLLGSGITRFDDAQDSPQELLRCMLCTLYTSKKYFKSIIKIVLYKGDKERNKFSLYENKDIFKIIR